jgi:hypothetical protein
VDPVTKKPQNHILRFWEKEFKEIKPKKLIIGDIIQLNSLKRLR